MVRRNGARRHVAGHHQLNGVINKALESAEMKKHLEKDGMIPTGGLPAKFAERINNDYNNWIKVIKSANIKSS